MFSRIFSAFLSFFLVLTLVGQDCPIINYNGDFEDYIFIPGGIPSLGISTGQIVNWNASHGTADYIDPSWTWYDLDGISSKLGHICYGSREQYNHSEGIFTGVKILNDPDLIYSLKLELANICNANKDGLLHIALNNKLLPSGHNFFQFPNEINNPNLFEQYQSIASISMDNSFGYLDNGLKEIEFSFQADDQYNQLWLYTEYPHEYENDYNCGILFDHIELTVTTNALESIEIIESQDGLNTYKPIYNYPIQIKEATWFLDDIPISNELQLSLFQPEESYTLCVDIIDSRDACGSICTVFDAIVVEPSFCNYGLCIDFLQRPKLTSFGFRDEEGRMNILNEKVDGFHFPYCIADVCEDSAISTKEFINDLNHYFELRHIEAKIQYGFEIEETQICREESLSILCNNIEPVFFSFKKGEEENHEARQLPFIFDDKSCIPQTFNSSGSEYSGLPIWTETNSQGKNGLIESLLAVSSDNAQIEIHSFDVNQNYNLFLFNSAGQKIKISNKNRIDISNLPVGIYFLSIWSKNKFITNKRIVKY